MLMRILETHQVHLAKNDNYLQIEGTDVEMNAFAFTNVVEHNSVIQLDINLWSRHFLGNRKIIESFAGIGETNAQAIGDAFNKFCRSSLHPLLSVFVNRNREADQVQWERWAGVRKSWDVCFGPLAYKTIPSVDIKNIISQDNLNTLINKIREAYIREATHEIHWMRIYYGSVNGQSAGRDVLLDNDPWVSGEEIFDHLMWPSDPPYYDIRLFIIAVPIQPGKKTWRFWERDK